MKNYERPTIDEMGSVADVTRGFSRSGRADNVFGARRGGGSTPTS